MLLYVNVVTRLPSRQRPHPRGLQPPPSGPAMSQRGLGVRPEPLPLQEVHRAATRERQFVYCTRKHACAQQPIDSNIAVNQTLCFPL